MSEDEFTVYADGTGTLPAGTPVIVDTGCPCGGTLVFEDMGSWVSMLCQRCGFGHGFTKGVVVE